MKRVEGAVELELEEKAEETGVTLPGVPHQLTNSLSPVQDVVPHQLLNTWTLVLEIKGHGDNGRTTTDILGGPISRRPKKGRNLPNFCIFCFLRLEDQNQFQGPGLGPLSILLCPELMSIPSK